jgi:hypothetical protein
LNGFFYAGMQRCIKVNQFVGYQFGYQLHSLFLVTE